MTHKLIEGFRKFHTEAYGEADLMARLVREGQNPDFFIISCIDSRSNPGTIFKPEPGTFFAHKAMGAIVRPYKQGTALAAALQFALDYNGVKEIIILGHTGCGAVRALVEKLDDEEISSFVDVAQKALHTAEDCCNGVCTHDELLRHTEEQIVLLSAENLKGYPSVARALKEGRASVRPWLFDMANGNLLEHDGNEFKPITDH
ncbi:MAG: hypothetical protein LRZ85_06980 [Alphaproteobacteria bacterium]|nr:hypothetical protein [Alphaproteobacteria bacterium]MCD8526145.1 hypothetical protein [Alphaproteobacteria bacterium]